jgi:hypothetical protein
MKKTLLSLIIRRINREPDLIIGPAEDPYMWRWWLIPRNRFFNVYLHCFWRSDDDRALHDHPWANCSILLAGKYVEHTISAGGVNVRTERVAPAIKFRLSGRFAHRVELVDGNCWTLFITGPRYRQWGFHCPDKGWVHWEDFTAPENSGEIGRGCE